MLYMFINCIYAARYKVQGRNIFALPSSMPLQMYEYHNRLFMGAIIKKYPGKRRCIAHKIIPRPSHLSASGLSWLTTCSQIQFLVPKDAQCSETFAKRIFRFFLNKIFIYNFWDLRDFFEPDSETLTSDTR